MLCHRGDRTGLILALMLGLIALAVANGVMGTSKVAHASDVLAKIKAGQPAEFDDYIIVDYLYSSD